MTKGSIYILMNNATPTKTNIIRNAQARLVCKGRPTLYSLPFGERRYYAARDRMVTSKLHGEVEGFEADMESLGYRLEA